MTHGQLHVGPNAPVVWLDQNQVVDREVCWNAARRPGSIVAIKPMPRQCRKLAMYLGGTFRTVC
jgi:hypothetical protein